MLAHGAPSGREWRLMLLPAGFPALRAPKTHMSVNKNSTFSPHSGAPYDVAAFAARHSLVREVVKNETRYKGPNPLPGCEPGTDRFIVRENGSGYDFALEKGWPASALKNFFETGHLEALPSPTEQKPAPKKPKKLFDKKRPFDSYPYVDAEGKLIFEVCRQGTGDLKAVRQRRPNPDPETANAEPFLWDLEGVHTCLYRLPHVLKATHVIVVEGEKAVEYLLQKMRETILAPDWAITTNPMGAGKWREHFNSSLEGKTVYIFPDNDEPGQKHADAVALALHGIAKEVRIVELPDRGPKWGADDWIASGREFAELLELTEAAPIWALPETAPPAQIQDTFSLDDIGNGRRFAAEHRETLRWDTTRQTWLIYTKGVWMVDRTLEVERRAIYTAERFEEMAHKITDMEQRGRYMRHAAKMKGRDARNGMTSDAKSVEDLAVYPELFDQNPLFFNLENGTYCMDKHKCLDHQPNHYLTRQAPFSYSAEARCTLWLRCLEMWLPDPDVRRYIQDCVGVSLSGEGYGEFFNFLYGGGENGKSVFISTLESLFGPYWEKTQAETLMAARDPRRAGAPNSEILQLKGARLVTSQEIGGSHKLDSELVKDLTGRDAISARGVHEKNVTTFEPQFTLWMFGNSKPRITDNTHGMWRRVRLINFNQTIPEHLKDPKLRTNLKAELAGIFNWAMIGLKRVQSGQFEVPEAIKAATNSYREESDPLGCFLEECITQGPGLSLTNATLWNAWENWAEREREHCKSAKWLTTELKDRGFEAFKSGSVRGFKKIALKESFAGEPPETSQVSQTEELGHLGRNGQIPGETFSNGHFLSSKKAKNHADSEPYFQARESGLFGGEN